MNKKTNRFEINIVHDVDREEWNILLLKSPDATAFHTRECLETLTKTYSNYKSIYIIARDENGKLIGGMPVIKSKSKFGFYSLLAMPFGLYGGPIVLSDCDDSESIRNSILKQFYKLSKNPLCISSQVADFSGKCDNLNSMGFKKEKVCTYIVNINSNIKNMWMKKINKKVRNEVRQAKKQDVMVEEISDISQVKRLYDMIKDTDKRHERTSYLFDLYNNLFNFMCKNGLVKWFIAKKNDVYVANSLYFTYNDSIMHWMNASYKKYWRLRPNNLLQWTIIEWGIENGYKYFNLGGLPTTEAKGLIKFKESWGAEKKYYYIYSMTNQNLMFKILNNVGKLLKLVKRGGAYIQENGLISFIKKAFLFLKNKASTNVLYQEHYIFEKNNDDVKIFEPKIKNVCFEIVRTEEQLSDLLNNEFTINQQFNINQFKKWLSNRETICCTFVEKDLASIVVVTRKENIKIHPPINVNYKKESYLHHTITAPEYWRLGLYAYTMSKVFKFLEEEGVCISKYTVLKDNLPPIKAATKFGVNRSGEGKFLKFFPLIFWNEKSYITGKSSLKFLIDFHYFD